MGVQACFQQDGRDARCYIPQIYLHRTSASTTEAFLIRHRKDVEKVAQLPNEVAILRASVS